ncbi:dTMP kinase [Corynebacterium sp. 335C]
MILAIEGIDGAGKNTLSGAVAELLAASGRTVARAAFPAYGETVFADLADDALHGRLGDAADSAWAMAVLFAADRRDRLEELRRLEDSADVLLLDRWVASNAAYTWARTGDEAAVAWLEELEFGRFGLPRPDLTVYLEAAPRLAADRAASREAADAARTRDRYERDGDLQAATADAYARLAERSFGGPWAVVPADAEPAESARRVLDALGIGG